MAAREGRRGKPFSADKRFKKLGDHPLGRGGKAEVWKARDTGVPPYSEDGVVAVKILRSESGLDEHERMRREGGEDRRFRHENVVQIYDLRGGPRSPFIVMEYIDGESCRELREQHHALSPERVAEIGIQLCAGLKCLHDAGLVHRDVKPGNVMVSGDIEGEGEVRVKLIDLGIAQAPDDTRDTRPGFFVGTPAYLAPEVVVGGPASVVSDIYSAGAFLYELATGDELWSLSHEEAITRRRVRPLPAPHMVNPEIPEWLSQRIMRALSLDPDQRFQGAEKMGEALGITELDSGEIATAVLPGVHDAPTDVIAEVEETGLTAVRPGLGGRARGAPSGAGQGPLGDGGDGLYPLLVVIAMVIVLFVVLLLPAATRVAVAIYEVPPGLLIAGALLGIAAVWVGGNESRRRALARQARRLTAAARSSMTRAKTRLAAARRRPLRPPCGEALRARSATRGASIRPFVHNARSQLVRAGSAWIPWLGRRVYFIVLGALTFCLALWLAPAFRERVALQPADHQTVLTAIPAAAWIVLALGGLLLLRASNARPRRLLFGGVILLVSLTAAGMLTPSFVSWLEPRLWPDEQTAEAQSGPSTQPRDRASALRKAARTTSRRLAVKVRRTEGRWLQLLWNLEDSWDISNSTRPAIRDAAGLLVSGLNSWRKMEQFRAAKKRARRWLVSMRRGASRLSNRDCESFDVGSAGVSVTC